MHKLTALILAAGIALGSTGTALAQSVSVGPAPKVVKAFTLGLPPQGYTIAPDGSGTVGLKGQPGTREFCIEHYGCTREPGQGGGPRWAHIRIGMDLVDGEWDGAYFGRPITYRR